MTDRETEQRIRDTPVYQIFCGKDSLEKFHVPDHTKIEEFRNRISPETQRELAILVIKHAAALGFTSFDSMDIDSTVQEAGIAYPSDAGLMKKLAAKAHAVGEACKNLAGKAADAFKNATVGIGKIAEKARDYFFRAKNSAIEKTRETFREYYNTVKAEVTPVLNALESLKREEFAKLPAHIRRQVIFLKDNGKKYLEDVNYFIENHTIKFGKLLSFHLKEVACIMKGKIGKTKEFGRVYQLGRLAGNFLVPFTCNNVQMNDKDSLIPVLEEFAEDFGAGSLKEISTDKGYYSKKNVTIPANQEHPICTDGVQRPRNTKNQPSGARVEELKRRRAGIEPLIGHVKSFGLGKSTMRSDKGVLASGYRSVFIFNLHQLQRKLAT